MLAPIAGGVGGRPPPPASRGSNRRIRRWAIADPPPPPTSSWYRGDRLGVEDVHAAPSASARPSCPAPPAASITVVIAVHVGAAAQPCTSVSDRPGPTSAVAVGVAGIMLTRAAWGSPTRRSAAGHLRIDRFAGAHHRTPWGTWGRFPGTWSPHQPSRWGPHRRPGRFRPGGPAGIGGADGQEKGVRCTEILGTTQTTTTQGLRERALSKKTASLAPEPWFPGRFAC